MKLKRRKSSGGVVSKKKKRKKKEKGWKETWRKSKARKRSPSRLSVRESLCCRFSRYLTAFPLAKLLVQTLFKEFKDTCAYVKLKRRTVRCRSVWNESWYINIFPFCLSINDVCVNVTIIVSSEESVPKHKLKIFNFIISNNSINSKDIYIYIKEK